MKPRRWLLWLALTTLLPAQVAPQQRPKIALVLEGGGALGFAHIGAIEFLEKNHIPVDLVVGTSMGGLIGGLYAVGNTTGQIHELIKRIEWDAVLAGATKFQDLSFRRKEDRIAFPNRLEFGLARGLVFPSGLNEGQQVGLILDRAALPYGNISSFDELPIPFRCVATDLTEGKEKVFASGSLPQALRATMSLPAIFSPVTIDGHLYSDGGSVNNLPVDVAKSAGADIIIAVNLDVGSPAVQRYASPLDVAARNVQVMVAANELRNMAAADILISADVKEFTSFSFNQGEQIIPRGFQAAERKQKVLMPLALNEADWQQYLSTRSAKINRDLPVPKRLNIAGVPAETSEAIERDLSSFVGTAVQVEPLEKALTRQTGNGVFSTMGYSLRRGVGGVAELEVRATPKSYGPPFLNLRMDIDGSNPENPTFGLAGRLTLLNLGGYRAEWRNDAFFGSQYGVTSEYYRPFTSQSKLFVAPRAYALNSPFDLYVGSSRIAQYRIVRIGFGVDLGYALSRRAEVRVGQDLFSFRARRRIADAVFPEITERQLQTSARFRYFGLDNVAIPRNGFQLEASTGWFQRKAPSIDFFQSEMRASFFKQVSGPGSAFLAANGGTSYGAAARDLSLQSFLLGGPFRLGAYGRNELIGSQYFLFQGGYLHKLLPLSPLIGEGVYALGFLEAGKLYDAPLASLTGTTAPVDASLALAVRTAIGPIFIGGSVGKDNHRKWWFGIGRIF